jgi:NADPH2:quinone reductase
VPAWQVTGRGEPEEVLRWRDVDTPRPGPGQVLVEVDAAAVTVPDLLLCRGTYHHKPPAPFTLGCEASGRIAAVGHDVDLAVGQRVLTAPLTYGCFAEQVLVSSGDILPIPSNMSPVVAAGLFMAYQTSWVALHRRARLQAGETLLVHGAAGGVGTAAVQLGKAAGARVIATAGDKAKAAACHTSGADEIIDHRGEDVAARVLDITAGRGADVVFDPVGGPMFEASRRCLAVEGRILVVGFAAGIARPVAVNHLLLKNHAIIGFRLQPFREDHAYTRAVHDELIRLHRLGAITPPVSAELSMSDAPEAVALLRERTVTGRVVLRRDPDGTERLM